MSDTTWMARALEMAARGRGAVEPNPMVGAVVVRDGRPVGEGWHQRYGGPHAEVHALATAGECARGATLYVTLEPCCHHGKTPPCTDAVVAAGVSRVVAAMADPFPEVAGKGTEVLRKAGVAVEVGVGEAEARRLNAPYLKLLAKGRPWVIAKWAMTLDGRIATRTGDSKWISNAASRRIVHDLRGRVDAVVVGVGTALADDPLLTARPPGPRTAARVVLDSRLRLPVGSQLVRTAREVPTLVGATALAPGERRDRLLVEGCEVMMLPEAEGRVSPLALLDELGRRRFTNVLVEGGGEALGSFLDSGEIDEAHVFLAPRLMGGAEARSPLLGRGVERVAEMLLLRDVRVESVDGDVYIRGQR
ncbi:MAG: bifunctional diaminohydroxyphosphoribosylaminopyrimidine deaminase/5-amino-6-(5-phosphoribosylamino)uracil reductase RibD [Gemmataceae bacterium]